MTSDFVSMTWESYAKDPLIEHFEQNNQKITFAIWEQMELLHEEFGIDSPKEIITIIQDNVEKAFGEYLPMYESFEEDFED